MPNEEGPQITIEEDLPQPSRGPGGIDLLLALALIWGVDLVAGLILAAISGLDPSKDPNPFHLLAATLVTWPTTVLVSPQKTKASSGCTCL